MRAFCAAMVLIGSMSGTTWAQAEKTPEEAARDRNGGTKKDPRELNPQWAAALERIRSQPRAGEIQNAGITAHITDVVAVPENDKAAIGKLQSEYDAAVLERAAKWEVELQSIRAQYEDKMLALLPAERREATRGVLKLSHDQWSVEHDLESTLQRGAAERFKKMPPREDKAAREKAREELRTWLDQQKEQARQTTADALQKIRALLLPDEVKRLEEFDRNRMAVPPAK